MNNFKYEYNGWNFTIPMFHKIYNQWKIMAVNEKLQLHEAMFVDEKYIDSEEKFIKECIRFYNNMLCDFETN